MDEPILFTSGRPVGMRRWADWGGIVLLGTAPINVPGGTEVAESFEPERAVYGHATSPNPAHDCGTLRYVRIEFFGYLFGAQGLTGLTLAGCGAQTELDHVHLHQGDHDGVELYGGTVNARHILVTQVTGDGIDWHQGYSGNLQFIAVQTTSHGDNGLEGDNWIGDNAAAPVSAPTIWNVTLVGSNGLGSEGIELTEGTAGEISNAIMTGFGMDNCIDVTHDATEANAVAGTLSVHHSIVHNCGTDIDVGMMGPYASWTNLEIDIDPLLGDPTNLTEPSFIPAAVSPAATGGDTPPNDGFFDTSATYRGAFAPGATGTANWIAGWTSFPQS
jgi:hypothetical protein